MSKKRIGLALGSGAARGLAHIGVLKVLEKHGIRPDYVSGSSMGAAVAAGYCAGRSVKELTEIARSTEWQGLMDFTLPRKGMLAGHKLEKHIQRMTGNMSFSQLHIPLRIVATDIKNSKKVIFRMGDVARAVRASISIPGVFMPVKIRKHVLIDGGIIDPVPIDLVREMGADIIIAVDLSIDFSKVFVHGDMILPCNEFFEGIKKEFIRSQVELLKKEFAHRARMPGFAKSYASKAFDSLVDPVKMYGYVKDKEMPQIVQIALKSILIMESQIAKAHLQQGPVDIVIKPKIEPMLTIAFNDVDKLIRAGECAAIAALPKLKLLLSRK
jgi:NTE family protein